MRWFSIRCCDTFVVSNVFFSVFLSSSLLYFLRFRRTTAWKFEAWWQTQCWPLFDWSKRFASFVVVGWPASPLLICSRCIGEVHSYFFFWVYQVSWWYLYMMKLTLISSFWMQYLYTIPVHIIIMKLLIAYTKYVGHVHSSISGRPGCFCSRLSSTLV